MIYFDYHATTPVLPEVELAMQPYLQKHFGNPSSTHSFGARTQMAVQKARNSVARLLKTTAEHIVFTSGATESIHTALAGWTLAQNKPCHIITSTIEHKATYGACRLAEKFGARISFVKTQSDGSVLEDSILSLIKKTEPTLVSVIHGNNEIGTVQDVSNLANTLKSQSVFFHVDAAQSVGKIPLDLTQTPIDFLSLSGHKIYGPKGVGALFVRNFSTIEPLFSGGGQEMNLRAGTHNVPSLVGLGAACDWFLKNGETETVRLQKLQKLFFELLAPLKNQLQIHGSLTSRLPNNIHFSLLHRNLSDLLPQFENVAFSSGSACSSSKSEETSHVLKALGVDERIARNTFRIGLGIHSTEKEIHDFCTQLISSLNTI
ncbi:cysteine desulfurase [bacterium]|nr:cysteine desulfurase [bacterium]